MNLERHVRIIPDFPKPGINFYDIVPVLADSQALRHLVEAMSEKVCVDGRIPNFIAGVEARGFPIAAAIAVQLGCGLILVRKPGKLPGQVLRQDYTLEYGSDAVELSQGVVGEGQAVAIVDDVLATGGTVNAVIKLLQQSKADIISATFFIELEGLDGAKTLGFPCTSLLKLPA